MVTNLEYLLAVNAAAGRVLGDRLCHPIIPWVSDLTCKMGEEVEEEGGGEGGGNGWRDLTMTKFRLQKGDAQVRSRRSLCDLGSRRPRACISSAGQGCVIISR